MDDKLLPAAQKAYDLTRWLLPCVEKFSRAYKFTLGDRIQTTALDLQLAVVEAGHARSKSRPLHQASRLLDQLRLLLRLARDVQVLSGRQHRYVSGLNAELGRMIGNLTSQLWANSYLCGFDHWVKQHLGAKGYVRFVDDFLLLGDDVATLEAWRDRIADRLEGLRLHMHPAKCVIRRVGEGVPFLGYVVWPDRIRVRGETVRRFRRRIRRRARHARAPDRKRSLAAWLGHVHLAGSWRRLAVR